jgi:hypothetical protein
LKPGVAAVVELLAAVVIVITLDTVDLVVDIPLLRLGRHWCCFGKDGETSYVTGYNIAADFCATGGGGAAMNGNGCYMHCGCYSNQPGCGSGGNAYGNGAPGGQSMYSDAQIMSSGHAGGLLSVSPW